MQAMPEINTPRRHPPIALFNDAPKNNPATAHKSITITETIVLNFFIQSHSVVKFRFIKPSVSQIRECLNYEKEKPLLYWYTKEVSFVAPQVGLEPTTLRLTAACSAS